MKKNYIAPVTNTYKVALASMIAASPNSISGEKAAAGSSESTVNFSRGGSWDDED